MSTQHETSKWGLADSLPLELEQRRDQICIQFESAWRAAGSSGRRPRIEDFLGDWQEPARSALLHELIPLDIAYRRLAGDEPRAEDYVSRFPSLDPADVAEAIGKGERPQVGSTIAYRPVVPRVQPGRYEAKRFHARGGMGEVWLALDTEVGREVALKRIRPERGEQEERFLAEAQITGQLEHPAIVPVHDLGMDEDGKPFYTMKFVRGRTFKDAIEEFHSPSGHNESPREVQQLRLLEVFVNLCQAVAYAHSRGVIHRDLKPDNVMLGEYGETIVLDWGLAKVLGHPEIPGGPSYVHVTHSGRGSDTLDGAVMGAPPYMAPEVAEGHTADVDEKTDVYLLGATLYELLTGRPPRQGSSREEIIELARTVAPVPPRQLNRSVPRALEAICLKAMARRKQDRYATATALADDVERYLAGEPVSAYSENLLERTSRWAKRHRRGIGYAAAALIVLAAGLAGFSKIRQADRARTAAIETAIEAELKTKRLAQEKADRADLAQFRQLLDEAQFYAANTDPITEKAPYYEPAKGEEFARAALGIADKWGHGLEGLTLADEKPALKDELYNLLLQLVHVKLAGSSSDAKIATEFQNLLTRAAKLREPTRSFYRLQADCYRMLGERTKAAEAQRLAEQDRTPTTALDHFLLADDYRKGASRQRGPDSGQTAGQPVPSALELAIVEYQKAIERDPDHFWAHFQVGRCLLGLDRRPEAVVALRTCVALRPDSPWSHSTLGFALALQGHFDDALRALNRAVELPADFRPARLNRGVVHWLQKEYEKALADFDAVLEPPDDKKLFEAAFYRGQVLLQRARDRQTLRETLPDFDLVAEKKPNFAPVYRIRARVHFLVRNDDAGMADLNRFLALTVAGPFDPVGAEACFERGKLLRRIALGVPAAERKRVFEQARVALEAAVARGGRSAELFDETGAVLDMLGKTDEAIEQYSEGIRLAQDDFKLLEKRGWAYAQDRQKQDMAAQDFQSIVRQEPKTAQERVLWVSAHTGLGWLHACRGEDAAANREAILALAHQREERHWGIPFNVATIYAELSKTNGDQAEGNREQAIAMLQLAAHLAKQAGAELELRGQMRTDEALKPVQNLPKFKELFDSLKPTN